MASQLALAFGGAVAPPSCSTLSLSVPLIEPFALLRRSRCGRHSAARLASRSGGWPFPTPDIRTARPRYRVESGTSLRLSGDRSGS